MPYFPKTFDDVLNKLDSSEGFQQAMTEPMRRSMETIHALLKFKSPIGLPPGGPLDPYRGKTASVRLGHSTIQESWLARLEANPSEPNTLGMKFLNFSEHVLYVVRGTPAHRIPKTGEAKLVFYWGDYFNKHRWGPQYHEEAKHRDEPPGIRRFKWVDHPGIQNPNPFIAQTKDDIRDPTKQDVKKAVFEYIRETIISSGFKKT